MVQFDDVIMVEYLKCQEQKMAATTPLDVSESNDARAQQMRK